MSAGGPPHAGRDATLHLVASARPGLDAQALASACATHPQLRGNRLVVHRATADTAEGGLLALAIRAAATARREGGVVLACGGDGTVNAVAQAAWSLNVPMAVLPHGTFNYFAREHRLGDDVGTAFDQMLQLLGGARCQPVPVGLLGDEVFVVNSSLGLYPRVLAARERSTARLGRYRWVAWASGLTTLLRPRPSLRLQLQLCDGAGQWHERKVNLASLFVGNNRLQMEQLGLPPPQADVLTALMVEPQSRAGLLRLAGRALLGQLPSAPAVEVLPFKSLELHAAGRLAHSSIAPSLAVAVDGEMRRLPLPLRIARADKPLWLLAPPAVTSPERLAATRPGALEAGRAVGAT